jgi:hypothetical protein
METYAEAADPPASAPDPARSRPPGEQLPDHPLAGAVAGLIAGLAPATALYVLLALAGLWLGRTAPMPLDAFTLPLPPVFVLLLGCALCGAATTLIHTPAERFELVRPGRTAFLAFVPGCTACLVVWTLLPNEWSPSLLARDPRPLTLDPLAAAAGLATADLAVLASLLGLVAGLPAGALWRPVYRALQRRFVPRALAARAHPQRSSSAAAERSAPARRATIIRHEVIDRQRVQPWRPVLPYAAPPEALEQRPPATPAIEVHTAAAESTPVPGLKRFLARTLTATAIVGAVLVASTSYYLLSRRTLVHDMQAVDADRPQALLRFQIDRAPHRLVIEPVGGSAEVELLLLDASRGVTVRSDTALRLGAPVRQPLEVSLRGLPKGEYYLRVQRTTGDLLFVYIVDQGGGWPASLALILSAALGASELALLVLTVRGMYLASALGK